MTEPDEGPGWKVQIGVGLLAHTPMSPERRAAFDREAEKERLQLEREAEQRRADAAERVAELAFRGVVPTSVDERLQSVGWAQDRADAVEARREREAAERLGKPPPRQWVGLLAAAKAEREAKAAAAEATPASEAAVERKFEKLKTTIENTFGKRLLK